MATIIMDMLATHWRNPRALPSMCHDLHQQHSQPASSRPLNASPKVTGQQCQVYLEHVAQSPAGYVLHWNELQVLRITFACILSICMQRNAS